MKKTGKPATKLPRYLSLSEVSEATSLSMTTLRRYLDSGALPFTQCERKLLLKESDVITFLESREKNRGVPAVAIRA